MKYCTAVNYIKPFVLFPQANFEEKENRLLYQISGLDEKVKAMARENDVLRQNHEGTYAEMSRLQDSKIALRKENDSLRGTKNLQLRIQVLCSFQDMSEIVYHFDD